MPAPQGAVDTVGMFDLAAGLPEQVEAAVSLGAGLVGLPARREVDNVVVLGMGGSAIAGDVMAAVAGPHLGVPVVVVKGYEVPAFVGARTLCFAITFSGCTEETLVAAEAAAARGARMVCLSHGGELASLAGAWGAPHIQLPGIAMPRAGIGAVSVPPLVVLERVGLLAGAQELIAGALAQLRWRRDQLIDGDAAAAAARRIGRTFPLAYGGGPLGEVAARRFKNQCNENAKVPAFFNVHPELCHNEICGWGNHGDVTRQTITVVELRHDFEHPQVRRRFELTAGLLEEVVAGIVRITAGGQGALAQLLDLVIQGDFVSLHLAAQLEVDPGPIPVLAELKAALGA